MADLCGDCAYLDLKDCKWGDRYYCKKERKRVTMDEKACNYFNNPDKKKDGYKRSGWYITTEICNILGYGKDSEVLVLLSGLRTYLELTESGRNTLNDYDTIGPVIAARISEEPNSFEIAAKLLQGFLIPASLQIKANNYDAAIAIYFSMVDMLKIKYNLFEFSSEITIESEDLGQARKRILPEKKKVNA